MEAALLERMYFCRVDGELKPPLPVDDVLVEQRAQWFQDKLVQEVRSFTPVSLADFPKMYKGPKRALYERAVESLWVRPVRRRDAESNSFVKREKAKFKKAPRCIQPRDPRYNAMIGRFIKPLEHVLYSAVGRMMGEGTVITKGLNLVGTAACLRKKWDSFSDPIAVGLDATAFDAHVSAPWLRWEHSIYNRICKNKQLARLLEWQVFNRGKAFCPDGRLRYRVMGRRFSGDMNTALGNCLIMCAMVYSWSRGRNVRIQLANNGDDCVVFMEREDLQRFHSGLDEYFQELGFRLTMEEPVAKFEAVEFCQMHPVEVDGVWRMVRHPRVAFEKDTMCTLTVSDDEYYSWLRGVSDCGLATTSGVPILQEFYLLLQRLSGHAKAVERLIEDTGMRRLSQGMESVVAPVHESTRFSFWLAYGVDPQTQRDLEAELRTMSCVPTSVSEFVGVHWPLDISSISFNHFNHVKQKQC